MRKCLPLLVLPLWGCLSEIGNGPRIGDCAEYPEGVYTYGQIGIGTCLSGPTDVDFIDADGRTWLVVANADPFLNFRAGGALLIDFDSIDQTKRRNLMHETTSYGLELESYVGEVAHLDDKDLLLVSGRLSPDTLTRDHDDRLHVVDISDPTNPIPWLYGDEITLKDDPYPVSVSADQSRAYVVNLSDHSVSVIDTENVPLSVIDVVGPAELGEAIFTDADNSGSFAELDGPIEVDATKVLSDQWTLSWLDGTVRLWIPRENGLERWNTGDGENYYPTGLGLELDPSFSTSIEEVRAPFLAWVSGSLTAYFSDRGTIRSATSIGTAGDWELSGAVTLSGDSETPYLSGPALSTVDNQLLLFHDVRTDENSSAAIGVAPMGDLGFFEFEPVPVLSPAEESQSYEAPFVLNEDGLLRMWFSFWDGAAWTMSYSESFDALTWTEPETLIALPGGHVAAPVVSYINGRYRLWATISEDGQTWSHATAWSINGFDWNDLEVRLPANDEFDIARPPRTAVQVDATGAWRIDARDLGPMTVNASAGDTTSSGGFSFTVANGHSIPTGILNDDASVNGLEPGAYIELDGVPTLFVTGIGDDTRSRLAALQLRDGEWQDTGTLVIDHENASHPVVVEDGEGWRLYYAAPGDDGRTRIHSGVSEDGLAFTRDLNDPIQSGESWDDLGQYPHSMEFAEDGSRWLWYAGDNGSRLRIGAASTTDGKQFTVQRSASQDYIFGAGEPGTFDDSGVKDPFVYRQGDQTIMLYAGFDGTVWHLGYASRNEQGDWERRENPYLDEGIPAMSGVPGTFSSGGVQSPVIVPGGDSLQVYYSGFDSFKNRIGYAEGEQRLFPIQRVPTIGDTLVFDTSRGDEESSVIELAQSVDAFTTDGTGTSGLVVDEARGFLYIPSKLHSHVYVVDIRDDSDENFVDANYLDIETLIQVPSTTGGMGFRSALLLPVRDQLLLTSREPDGVVILDLSTIEDNNVKESTDGIAVGVLPLRDLRENEGAVTLASIGGAGMAVTQDESLLLVTNFRGNSVTVFDLNLGLYGEEIRHIDSVGENPHVVAISPDERVAVVANYVGNVIDNEVSSTLAIIDLDPSSERYLEVITWLVNQ